MLCIHSLLLPCCCCWGFIRMTLGLELLLLVLLLLLFSGPPAIFRGSSKPRLVYLCS